MSVNEPNGELGINEILQSQRRARRIRFWCGFLVIALVGIPWASLLKEPVVASSFYGIQGNPGNTAVQVVPETEATPDASSTTTTTASGDEEPEDGSTTTAPSVPADVSVTSGADR